MKKILVLVMSVLLLAACGSLNNSGSAPEQGQVESQIAIIGGGGGGGGITQPTWCPTPCCNTSVTFLCTYGVSVAPTGTGVSVYSSIQVAFRDPQNPANISVSVSPGVTCAWVWSSDYKQVDCAPQGRLGRAGLSYGTTYTVTVQRWGGTAWSTWVSNTFTTESLIYRGYF